MEDSMLFETRLVAMKAQAERNGGSFREATGEDLEKGYNSRPVFANFDDLVYHDGDTIEIPEWGAKGWLRYKRTSASNEVITCLARGKDAAGNPILKEFSSGTVTKSLLDRNTNERFKTQGTVVNEIVGCGDDVAIYKKLAGKKLRFSKPKKVEYIFRPVDGQPRNSTGNVFTIDIVE